MMARAVRPFGSWSVAGQTLLAWIACAAAGWGNGPLTDEQSVEAARGALGGFSGFPWYDRTQDDLRRVDVRPPAEVGSRKSKWVYQPVQWSFPSWFRYLLEATGWLILTLAILLVIYALLRALGWADFAGFGKRAAEEQDARRGDLDRVESLPFPLQRPNADLLAEARRCYERGNYEMAMIYLYSYQLVQLDRHHVIRLTKGKTNRQYLREIRRKRELWDVLRASMVAFEDVFFGHHSLERSRFDRCWNQLDFFHQQLQAGGI